MAQSSVSVIIPNYNYGKYIAETLKSVLNQTFFEYEVIVIDDGSKDNSVEIIKSFSDDFKGRLLLIEQKNKGVYAARNNGIKRSNGKYIIFLDADDIWIETTIKDLIHYLDNHPDEAMVYANTEYFESNSGNYLGKNFDQFSNKKPYIGKCVKELFIHGNFVPLMTVAIRRNVLESIGSFDEKLRVGGDYDFFMKVATKFKLGYLDKVLCKVRRHDSNLTFKALPQSYVQLRIIRNILTFDPNLSGLIGKKAIQKKWYDAYYHLGYNLILNGYRKRGRIILKKALRINKDPFGNKIVIYYILSYFPYINSVRRIRDILQSLRNRIKKFKYVG